MLILWICWALSSVAYRRVKIKDKIIFLVLSLVLDTAEVTIWNYLLKL